MIVFHSSVLFCERRACFCCGHRYRLIVGQYSTKLNLHSISVTCQALVQHVQLVILRTSEAEKQLLLWARTQVDRLPLHYQLQTRPY